MLSIAVLQQLRVGKTGVLGRAAICSSLQARCNGKRRHPDSAQQGRGGLLLLPDIDLDELLPSSQMLAYAAPANSPQVTPCCKYMQSGDCSARACLPLLAVRGPASTACVCITEGRCVQPMTCGSGLLA